MLDEMNNLEPTGGLPPEEASNRTFLIAAGILGAVLLLSLVATAIYAMVILPRTRAARATQQAEIYAQNTAVALGLTQTAQAPEVSPTPSPLPTSTSTPTSLPLTGTPVMAPQETTETPTLNPTEVKLTQDVMALLTQAAESQWTQTPTALPQTGFADEVGVPGLLAIALALFGVILIVRRLRVAAR
jgi:LPXTG-motif cell wall-anchored protein